MVSATMRVPGSASFSSTACGSSGAYRYSPMQPMMRAVSPAALRSTTVYKPSCIRMASRMAASCGSKPTPQ